MATIAVQVYNYPTVMTEYIEMAMQNAGFETLEDGTIYAEIPGFQGVWAEGETIPEVREELREVLQEWVEFRLLKDLSIPRVGGIDVKQLV
jgi:predicted RNase H-like HicB family nuclease